jgi:hypothetical protein
MALYPGFICQKFRQLRMLHAGISVIDVLSWSVPLALPLLSSHTQQLLCEVIIAEKNCLPADGKLWASPTPKYFLVASIT